MKKTVKYIVISVIGGMLLIGFGLFYLVRYISSFAPSEYVYKTAHPMSLAEARGKGPGKCPIDLPGEATEIQYARYSCWQAYVDVVRFHAPVAVCRSQALKLIEKHNEESAPDFRAFVPITFKEIHSAPDAINPCSEINIRWFDIENIKKGVFIGEFGSHIPRIWIDEEKEIFYYLYTD